ncbi:MAG TPA: cytidylate kinase-like family protein [Thermoanaerobaculaceae bacterium]|nr:cytidylate kinase-like family protein [Thermoanaerobaculaceae bacterium]
MTATSTTVLSISRQLGSGGSFVGRAVASRLGMRYVDREILQRAAADLGLGETDLAASEEKAAGFWDRLFLAFSGGAPDAAYLPPAVPAVYETDLFGAESRVIRDIADRFDAIIVGRAGFHVLAGHPGLVSVRLHAPRPWRVRRVMEVYGIADEAKAALAVDNSDHTRAQFIRTFAGVTWNDACAFDLCLNTATVGLDQTVELVATLVSARRQQLARPATGAA